MAYTKCKFYGPIVSLILGSIVGRFLGSEGTEIMTTKKDLVKVLF